MAALLQVTRDYEKNVYMLTGHGEHDMTDSDRNKGYTTFHNVLEQEFYHVKPLSLFGHDEIPKDAATIIIAGPRRDMLPEEALKLDRYLRAGGSLLVAYRSPAALQWRAPADGKVRATTPTCGDADNLFLKQKRIAIGWAACGDLGKLPADRDAFKTLVAETFPDYKPGAIPTSGGQ